jgi:predicted nucleic acid-binding protein
MIAATALELEMSIATLNRNHFAQIPDLILEPIPGA